jgi:nucleolar MIF4G domain-containing protein 1
MWWLPSAGESAPLASRLGGGTLGGDGTPDEETAALLRLAAAQRMNTDARRAVFVAIMGSDDCVEAHEKLLRLPLKGEQEREVVRVLMHCALAESSWNPYYGLLALKLCKSSKGNRMTLQFALWDAFKDLSAHSAAQLVTLARLAGLCVAKSALPLAMLKVVDLGELDARGTFFWRLFFRFTLAGCKDGGDVQEVFLRLTQQRKTHAPTIAAMLTFVRGSVGPWLASQVAGGGSEGGGAATAGGALSQGQLDELLRRVRMAERVLSGGR